MVNVLFAHTRVHVSHVMVGLNPDSLFHYLNVIDCSSYSEMSGPTNYATSSHALTITLMCGR